MIPEEKEGKWKTGTGDTRWRTGNGGKLEKTEKRGGDAHPTGSSRSLAAGLSARKTLAGGGKSELPRPNSLLWLSCSRQSALAPRSLGLKITR